MGDAYLPATVRFVRRIINWIQRRPTLYKIVHRLAERHEQAMGFRKFGI